jgi:hypothetical protein
MRVCSHKGYKVVVFTRDEHCPPHVHVGTADWDARFLFSFWHDSVSLWDVGPTQRAPCGRLLEELRQVVKRRANLRRARECWWISRNTLCLENQGWDIENDEVALVRSDRTATLPILWARFDPLTYVTQIRLSGHQSPLEIEL